MNKNSKSVVNGVSNNKTGANVPVEAGKIPASTPLISEGDKLDDKVEQQEKAAKEEEKPKQLTLKGFMTLVAQSLTSSRFFVDAFKYATSNEIVDANKVVSVILNNNVKPYYDTLRAGDKLIYDSDLDALNEEKSFIGLALASVNSESRPKGIDFIRRHFSRLHEKLQEDEAFIKRLKEADKHHPWVSKVTTSVRASNINAAAVQAYDLFLDGTISEETANVMLKPFDLTIAIMKANLEEK